MSYIIYESAITSPVKITHSDGNIVEFETILQEADVKNRNGRIYPKQVIDDGLKNPIVQEKIRTNSWFGEAGHPYSQDVSRQMNVDLRNIAFRILYYWWEGNLLKAKCRTLDTALGRDMAGLIKDGCGLSFSMRGQGNVVRDPIRDALVVQSPLLIICYDWVFLPSHNVAYITNICETTQESFARFSNNSNDLQMCLQESMNLYENGLMINTKNEPKKEPEFIDLYQYTGKKFKTIDEMYFYDPKDTIVESNNFYVVLENTEKNYRKKVSKSDYVLEAVRHGLLEEVGAIAPIATTLDKGTSSMDEASTEPSNPGVTMAAKLGLNKDGVAKDPRDEIKHGPEVELDYTADEPTVDELEIKTEIKDDNSELKKNVTEDVVLPDGVLERKPEENTPDADNETIKCDGDEESEDVKPVPNVDAVEHKEPEDKEYTPDEKLNEEIELVVSAILSEDPNISDSDLCKKALEYSSYMSEECINFFRTLSKTE